MGKYRIYYGIVLLATILLFLWTNTAQVLLALCLLVFFPLLSGFLTAVWVHTLCLELSLPVSCSTGQEAAVHFKVTKKQGGLPDSW